MRKVAFFLAFLANIGHVQQTQASNPPLQQQNSGVQSQKRLTMLDDHKSAASAHGMLHPLRTLAMLFLSRNPAAAFKPSSATSHCPRGKAFPVGLHPLVAEGQNHPRSGWWASHPSNRASGLRALTSRMAVNEEGSILAAKADETKEPDRGFDLQKVKTQFQDFWEMSLPYFQENKVGRRFFYAVIALTLLNSGISVVFSYARRDFWSALSAKDVAEFQLTLGKFLGALAVAVPIRSFNKFTREQLSVNWREWMTDRTLQLYYSDRVYYSLERGSEIDNPDQRIAEDVDSFTRTSLDLFISVATAIIDLVSFSAILYSIQPSLFGAIIAYALFGTLTTAAIGRSLVGLNFKQLRKEADLRYALVRFRENAESIAFYAGEDNEGKQVSQRLRKVVDNQQDLNVAQRNLNFFTTAYYFLVQVLPVAVIAPQYFSGEVKLGVVSQSNGAFNHVLDDFSLIVDNFETLSSFSAGIDRLSSFMKTMRDVDMGRAVDSALMKLPNETLSENSSESLEKNISMNDVESIRLLESAPLAHDTKHNHVLTVKNFSLSTPDRKRLLIKDMDLSLDKGENLLIVGNSGAGKSSFLRAIAGLWTAGSGVIERPSSGEVYFLPQRPYCSIGSLKEQLLYPTVEDFNPDDYPEGHVFSKSHVMKQSLSDQDLLDILKAVDLQELPVRAGDGDPVKGLGAVLDFSNVLSLGEQQRLAFGRLLVNKPRLAILDEATSALDVEAEARMYGLLQDMVHDRDVGLTYISVGHRPSLLRHHDLRLRLSGIDKRAMDRIERRSDAPRNVAQNM